MRTFAILFISQNEVRFDFKWPEDLMQEDLLLQRLLGWG